MVLTSSDIILILVGFIFPPLAAVLKRGCRADFIINCALTMLGYVPGVIHAWYLILKYPAIADYQLPTHAYPQSPHGQGHIVVVTPGSQYAAASSSQQPHDPPPSYGSIARDGGDAKPQDRKP